MKNTLLASGTVTNAPSSLATSDCATSESSANVTRVAQVPATGREAAAPLNAATAGASGTVGAITSSGEIDRRVGKITGIRFNFKNFLILWVVYGVLVSVIAELNRWQRYDLRLGSTHFWWGAGVSLTHF